MLIKEFAQKYNVQKERVERLLQKYDRVGGKLLEWTCTPDGMQLSFDDRLEIRIATLCSEEGLMPEPEIVKQQKRKELEAEQQYRNAIADMLVSSGFTFDGYRIIKYSGYISGDDAIEIPRTGWFNKRDTANQLTKVLVKLRIQALKELKEAAYELGCNAIIGVDFDYLTIEPETAGIHGSTIYEPYIICVTANGNAVVIEKVE